MATGQDSRRALSVHPRRLLEPMGSLCDSWAAEPPNVLSCQVAERMPLLHQSSQPSKVAVGSWRDEVLQDEQARVAVHRQVERLVARVGLHVQRLPGARAPIPNGDLFLAR